MCARGERSPDAPNEPCSYTTGYDSDRNRIVVTNQVLYYPYWESVADRMEYFNRIFAETWVNGNVFYNITHTILNKVRARLAYLKAIFKQIMLRVHKE